MYDLIHLARRKVLPSKIRNWETTNGKHFDPKQISDEDNGRVTVFMWIYWITHKVGICTPRLTDVLWKRRSERERDTNNACEREKGKKEKVGKKKEKGEKIFFKSRTTFKNIKPTLNLRELPVLSWK